MKAEGKRRHIEGAGLRAGTLGDLSLLGEAAKKRKGRAVPWGRGLPNPLLGQPFPLLLQPDRGGLFAFGSVHVCASASVQGERGRAAAGGSQPPPPLSLWVRSSAPARI